MKRNKLFEWGILSIIVLITLGFVTAEALTNKDLTITDILKTDSLTIQETHSGNVCIKTNKKNIEITDITEPLTMEEIGRIYSQTDTKGNNKECFTITKDVKIKDNKVIEHRMIEVKKR